jgi:hypothetical protein
VRPRPLRARRATLALFGALLALSSALAGSLARAAAPVPGGEVPSTLALSLSEPGPFKRVGAARRGGLFATTIRAEVTATDVPARLSVADGDSGSGRRRGHLGRGASILPSPLEASADGGPLRSLAARVPAPLRIWRAPVSGAMARIRLRQRAPSARAVRGRHKLLLVTLTAGGP